MESAPPTTHASIFEVLDDNSRGRVRAEGKGVYRQASVSSGTVEWGRVDRGWLFLEIRKIAYT